MKAFVTITKSQIREVLESYNYQIKKSKYDEVCEEVRSRIKDILVHIVLESANKIKSKGNERLIK